MPIVDLSCSCGSGLSAYSAEDGSPTQEQRKWLVGHVNAGHEVHVPPWWSALMFRIKATVRGRADGAG